MELLCARHITLDCKKHKIVHKHDHNQMNIDGDY